MTTELTNILASCRTICEHPYDNEVVLDTTYNGHHIRKYERSLAAVVIDNQVINMGVINERYPNGHGGFQVQQVSMTGLQYVQYKLTGLLPMMVTCPECGSKFAIFPDDVVLDYGYRVWCDDCDYDFEVDIPQEWTDFLGTDEPDAALPEPGNDTGAMVEYTDGSESWEDVHYTVSYEGKVFPQDKGSINYQHYNSWDKAIAMYDYCDKRNLDPYLHDNHYGVCLHNGDWY